MGKLISSACDACRQRKIKCCASTPRCSNCRASDIPCKYDMPRRKRGPKPRDRTRGESASSSAQGTDAVATASTNQGSTESPGAGSVFTLASRGHDRMDTASPGSGATATIQPTRLPSIRADPMFAHLPSLDHHRDFGHSHRVAPWGPSPTSPRDSRLEDRLPSPAEIQRTLVTSLEKNGVKADVVARQCLDKISHVLFGIIPIFNFRALHDSVPLLLRLNSASLHSLTPQASLSPYHAQILEDLRAFALLTAICAAICSVGTGILLPQNTDIAVVHAFLGASRDMLAHFQDVDLEHPKSSSLTLRIMQSTAFHFIGRTQVSLNVMGSAYRLALVLRLFDEETVAAETVPQEAQILRNLFWVMFMTDKSASVLNEAPVFMHELCFNEPITLSLEGKEGYHLLDNSRPPFQDPYEAQVHQGFYLTARLFRASHDVLLDLKLLARMRSRATAANAAELELPSSGIMSAYVDFCGILDALPRWLRDPTSHVVPDDESTTDFHQRTFWTQRGNLLVTFHCLRMVILRRAAKLGLCRLIGLIDDQSMIALRKTDIAHDMVSSATSVPFEFLQVNGEPLVEKLRQVGVDLLEMIQSDSFDSAISSRARAIFGHLLDLISRLDSKVSRELAGDVVEGGK